MSVTVLGFLFVGCEEPNPSENNVDYVSRSGKLIYSKTCVSCHGPNGKLCSSGAKDLSKSKMDSTNIVKIITNGKNGMPRQGSKINTEEEMSNLVEFVKSLRK